MVLFFTLLKFLVLMIALAAALLAIGTLFCKIFERLGVPNAVFPAGMFAFGTVIMATLAIGLFLGEDDVQLLRQLFVIPGTMIAIGIAYVYLQIRPKPTLARVPMKK
jgi:hypothetical protein